MALIQVRDTGPGMAEDVARRVFEPFYTTKEVGRGTGLGLSQVYGFVSQSGGRIDVSTTPGEGAAFALTLPLTDETPAAEAAEVEAVEVESGSERVLIVEDDPAVLSLCLDMLASLGYRCDVASNAAGALHRLETDPDYDLLFSDVIMPGGMNGIELAQKAQERHPDLKVLLTSGYLGETGNRMQHDFPLIDKPYQCADLANRLRTVLGAPAMAETK
jgi:CheY-like chemotaxis protein